MMAHGAGVAREAVAPPARAQLDGRRPRRAHQARRADRAAQQAPLRRAVDRRRRPVAQQRQHGVEVVDLQLAGDVRAGQAELARGEQRMGDGAQRLGGGTQSHGHAVDPIRRVTPRSL